MSKPLSVRPCSKCGKPCRGEVCMSCIKKAAKPVYDTCYVCGAKVSAQRHRHMCKSCAGKATGEKRRSKKKYPDFLTCQWCGKQFPFKYFYRFRSVKFCSHRCCTLARHAKEGNTKEGVEKKITDYIREKNRYCPRGEIKEGLHIAEHTFRHWGIDCVAINNSLGFFVNERMKLRNDIIKEIATGKHHNLKSVCAALNVDYAEARRISWRTVGGLDALFAKAGVHRSGAKYATKEELESAIINELKAEGAQLPAAELVRRLHFDYDLFVSFGCSMFELHHRAGVKHARNCSYQELVARRVLSNSGVVFEEQKKFDDCRSPISNRRLWFDFYLPSKNTLIEIDGEQHYDDNHALASKKLKTHDAVKTRYAAEKGINLVRVRIMPKSTFEQRFDEKVKEILGVVKAVELLERS